MSNHFGDTNKKVSETPRTDAVNKYLRTRDDYTKTDHEVWMDHSCDIERELNAANERIKRLIEAGDRMDLYAAPHDSDRWNEAKEDKP